MRFLLFFCILFTPLAATTVRRAAFDIGSGRVKFQVSDIDLTTHKIVNTPFVSYASVHLKEDLLKSSDGNLSLEIQNKMIETISRLVQEAAPFHPEAYHAIATEGLRMAKNGPLLAERITKETGVPVTLVSQEEEGRLGFVSALNEIDSTPENVVVWDFGGGSFQMTAQQDNDYLVYKGRLGKGPLKTALLTLQGKADLTISPNPISKADALRTVQRIQDDLKDFPDALRQKLKHADVVVLGIGIHPLWSIASGLPYDPTHLWQEITARLNLDDAALCSKDQIPEEHKLKTHYIVSNLILAYGIMHSLGIDHVQYVGTDGANAVGTLLSPHYWEEK